MTTVLSDISLPAIEYICLNMRSCDREEIYNILPHDSPIRLAWEAYCLINNNGRGRVAWHQGKPAAVISLTEDRPAIWQISMFGTDDFKNVAFPCMRWARETLRELASPPMNGRRLQCDSRVGHEEAAKFLLALGAQKEGPPMRHYGKDGGDYQRFVWLIGDNDHVLRREEQHTNGPEVADNAVRAHA